ncbi:MAG TPA: hypothetical protein PKD24_06990 [Pyrinomonadaceae bacterium]|nr:hypothetical protein [Pyrinomonadaceae bacterium]HMP65096.1 hypothetical protein [Pyrinomonadaceae bacterium]
MKSTRSIVALAIMFSLSFLSSVTLSIQTVYGQEARAALHRGYRTGYSDGYMAGYRDAIDNVARNVARHSEYADANRAYQKDHGSLEDYRDGYRQGFEIGYETGFGKRPFESAVPAGLAPRGLATIEKPAETVAETVPEPAVEVPAAVETEPEPVEPETVVAAVVEEIEEAEAVTPANDVRPVPTSPIIRQASYVPNDDPIIIIPRDTELILEIQEELNTEQNRVGDRFTARVVSPYEIEGAVIEGRIERITKPGRIKRRSEMLLAFDRIVISEHRWSNFAAILTEVMPVRGDNVRLVDDEGAAVGRRTLKEDGIKIGAAAGAGMGIGALTAGPVGAAVGAGVGAAFGVGAVVVERGKHIRLNRNQQLKIRSSFETRIR